MCVAHFMWHLFIVAIMKSHTKLELCAFALKGEHNVYSLIPNIPVCIYIDQKWIYIKLYSASSRFEHCSNHFKNCFTKWPPAPILDVRNSLLIAFLAISDRYATLNYFWNFWQNDCRRQFWMSEINFRSHFWPFYGFFL